jgi:hypothetical protein
VAGSCGHGDEHSISGATELVSSVDRAITQAARCWLLTADTQVQSLETSVDIHPLVQ